MSKKPLVVKTYGRHRYRTVKAQTWLSPDEASLSPFGDQTRFPSKFESAPPGNIFKPKLSSWNNPTKKTGNSIVKPSNSKNGFFKHHSPTLHSDKENSFLSPPNNDVSLDDDALDRRLKRKRQNLFSNSTPASVQRRQHSTSDSGFNNTKLDINKPEVILVNDSLEIREDSKTKITQEDVCIQDSKEYRLSPDNRPSEQADMQHSKCNVSTNGFYRQRLDDNVLLRSYVPSPKENNVANGLENGNYTHLNDYSFFANTSGFNRCLNSYVTSTPVFDAKMSPAITGNSCESDSQSSILMDGKVVLEPLRITPIQWQKCLSASSEKSGSSNSYQSTTDDVKKLEGSNSSGITTRRNPSVEFLQCVVSLERLRITPLKKRSRYYLGGIPASDASAGNKVKSHLSFAEALTPSKRKQTTWNATEKEEVQLGAFDKILLECDQEKPVKFADILDSSLLKSCVKIGEGVYGEVFQAKYENGESIALKIIPVEGNFEVNCTPQKTFEEILPEIVISKELSQLAVANEQDKTTDNTSTSFITVHSVTCCRDKYPEHLISEWDKWDKNHNSENDRPDVFASDQYFIVFEFSNGGRDLESFEFGTLSEAWSVLHQTALSLAVAENALQFEHRDLHWGNVLIGRTDEEFIESCLLGETKVVPTRGVRVSLIDFTLSRLNKDGLTVFCNLAEDESLFTGKGDYQFDVYRLMKKATQNDWEQFEPHTNALWLHYLADKLLKKKKYPSKDKDMEAKLKRFLRQARKCSSATEIVQDLFD